MIGVGQLPFLKPYSLIIVLSVWSIMSELHRPFLVKLLSGFSFLRSFVLFYKLVFPYCYLPFLLSCSSATSPNYPSNSTFFHTPQLSYCASLSPFKGHFCAFSTLFHLSSNQRSAIVGSISDSCSNSQLPHEASCSIAPSKSSALLMKWGKDIQRILQHENSMTFLENI